MIRPWPLLASRRLADYRIFRVRRDDKRSPRTAQEHDFYVLECPVWVNVVALTLDGQVILVEQYRHGTNTIDLEIPGGVTDPTDASPVETAIRELREETGYTGQRPRVIGRLAANPAIMDNLCYTVLVEDCVQTHAVEMDHAEDLVTHLVPRADLPALVQSGRIQHSLVVAAFYHLDQHYRTGR